MDRKVFVSVGLSLLTLLASSALWWLVSLILGKYLVLTTSGWLPLLAGLLAALFVFLAAAALVAILIEPFYVSFAVLSLAAVPIVFLIRYPLPLVITILAVAAALCLLAHNLHERSELFTKFSVGEIFSDFFKYGFLVFSIVLSVGFYFFAAPNLPSRIELPDVITEKLLEAVLGQVGQSLDLPGEGGGQESLDWMIEEGREEDLAQRISENFPGVLEEQGLDSENIPELFDRNVQQSSLPSMSLSNLKKMVDDEVNRLLRPVFKYIPLILSVSLLMTLWLLATPVAMAVTVGFKLIVKLLIVLKVFHLSTETVQAERLGM